MTKPTNATVAGRVYLELRKKAKSEGRSTDELLQLHALEAFVDRLATSPRAEDFVLKGGVLLSAYEVRRPTRDVDLSSRNVPNVPVLVEAMIDAIARSPRDDGWELHAVSSESIRENAFYSGVRVTVRAALASARQEFHVDVSSGDPIVPAPRPVSLERLLGGTITLQLPAQCRAFRVSTKPGQFQCQLAGAALLACDWLTSTGGRKTSLAP